jgi:hypothetical protein
LEASLEDLSFVLDEEDFSWPHADPATTTRDIRPAARDRHVVHRCKSLMILSPELSIGLWVRSLRCTRSLRIHDGFRLTVVAGRLPDGVSSPESK